VAQILSTTSGVSVLDEDTSCDLFFPWDKKVLSSVQNAESIDASTACYSCNQCVCIHLSQINTDRRVHILLWGTPVFPVSSEKQ
jgi:hypothetical protein